MDELSHDPDIKEQVTDNTIKINEIIRWLNGHEERELGPNIRTDTVAKLNQDPKQP